MRILVTCPEESGKYANVELDPTATPIDVPPRVYVATTLLSEVRTRAT
jgi:hypothetical protein